MNSLHKFGFLVYNKKNGDRLYDEPVFFIAEDEEEAHMFCENWAEGHFCTKKKHLELVPLNREADS